MGTRPQIVTAAPIPIAAVRRRATSATIGTMIRGSGVWDLMKARGITSPGRNVVVYWASTGARLDTPGGIEVDIGADVTAPFESAGELLSTATPSGRALHMTHAGPYQRLGESYDAMATYARANSLEITGPFWEIYGHWNNDPALLETEIYHLIA